MDFDENYLDELLKSIEPIIGPDESEEADAGEAEAIPDVPEEELDSDVAEPLEDPEAESEAAAAEEPAPEPEPVAEQEPEPEPVAEPEPATLEEPAADADAGMSVADINVAEMSPEEATKQLSPDEIAAMFNSAAEPEPAPAEEPAAEETAEEETSDAAEDGSDLSDLLDAEEPLEIDLDSPDLASLIADEDSGDLADGEEADISDLSELADLADADAGEDVSLENLLKESMDEDSAEAAEPEEIDLSDEDAIMDSLMGEAPSLGDLLDDDAEAAEGEEPEGELMMSADEIDALLNAAESAGTESDDADVSVDENEDLMSLLESSDDEDLGDIHSLLDSDEKGEAVDAAALLAAEEVEDVAAGVLDTPEEAAAKAKEEKKKAKLKAKEDKKAAKAAKKAGKKGGAPEEGDAEGEGAEAKPKKGLLASLLGTLTESYDEEEEAATAEGTEGEGGTEDGEVANISDENKEIMEELDKEQGKKKGKKAKKKKKKKGKGGEEGAEGEAATEGAEGEEGGKKKKKKERKKKEKAPDAEEVPAKPEKKLPKKRVRATFILCLSILAGIVIITLVMTKITNLQEARYAFDRQDYQTTYEDLYGLELKGEDADIFNKSQIMLMLDRKLRSYQNYKKLGMEEQALHALLEGVDIYPDIRAQAESYGIEPQVDYTYSQITDALGTYGLSEADAKEINSYESKVKYTKRIDSIVHGTPFTYDEDIAAEYSNSSAPGAEAPADGGGQSVDDILPPETDFLPDDPNSIFDDGTAPADAPEGAPADAPAGEPGDSTEGREIPADVELIPTDEGNV